MAGPRALGSSFFAWPASSARPGLAAHLPFAVRRTRMTGDTHARAHPVEILIHVNGQLKTWLLKREISSDGRKITSVLPSLRKYLQV